MRHVADGHSVWDPACFFLTSVGYTIGWTAISSMLASFKRQFGPAVLLQLNMAYFLPSIPVLFLQTQLDAYIDRRIGLPQATAARMILGLGGAGVVCALFPFVKPDLVAVLVLTCMLGICGGVAFGSSYQLVSHFSITCSVALTIGFVGSGPVVLLLEVLDKVGPHPTQSQRILLYSVIVPFFTFLDKSWPILSVGHTSKGGFEFIFQMGSGSKRAGLGAVLALINWHCEALLKAGKKEARGPSADLEHRALLLEEAKGSPSASQISAYSELSDLSVSMSEAEHRSVGGSTGVMMHRQHWPDSRAEQSTEALSSSDWPRTAAKPMSGFQQSSQLLAEVWPAALALSVSVGCATLLFPFFTYCPSSGHLGTLLPQVLFFARTISDIIGRFIPHSTLRLDTQKGLHMMTALKLAATPVGFWYIAVSGPRSDAAAVLYISLFWLQSGAVNSAAFVMANEWVSPSLRGRAGGFLALCFQTSCLVALAVAFAIQKYFAPFSTEAA